MNIINPLILDAVVGPFDDFHAGPLVAVIIVAAVVAVTIILVRRAMKKK